MVNLVKSFLFSVCPRTNSTLSLNLEILYVVYFPVTHPTLTAIIYKDICLHGILGLRRGLYRVLSQQPR